MESNDSIVMNYDPGIIPNTVVTPKHEGQRLGVIVHRYGNVEVKVTPTMENEMRFDSKNNMLETFSKTQSTEPVFSNNYPGGRNEEVRYNDIDIDRSKTSLRSDYNASKLKRQLDDMQNEIERLAFGKSFSKLDNLETNRLKNYQKCSNSIQLEAIRFFKSSMAVSQTKKMLIGHKQLFQALLPCLKSIINMLNIWNRV